MTAAHADQIIAGYMRRLDTELTSLPRSRREELTEEIAEHIAEARQELTDETDADLLTILDRVGEPAEIAGEARTRLGVAGVTPGPLEILALLIIGVGDVLFPVLPVAWVVGAGLVWRSGAWSSHQKRLGVYLPLVVLLVIDLSALLLSGAIGSHMGIAIVFIAALLGVPASLGSAVYLGSRLGRRLPVLAWTAIVVVALAVYVPAVAALAPARNSAFIVAVTQPDSAGQTTCGGFYGTYEYAPGTPLAASAPVSVGICWDGQKVTKSWGPDCFPDYGPALVVHVAGCHVETWSDGSMSILIESSDAAATAPFFGQSASVGWRITPDGHIDRH